MDAATEKRDVDRARLAKLLGMLGSVHDGEVLSAARKIHGMIRDADVSWQHLLKEPVAAPPPPPPPRSDKTADDLYAEDRRATYKPWKPPFSRRQRFGEAVVTWVDGRQFVIKAAAFPLWFAARGFGVSLKESSFIDVLGVLGGTAIVSYLSGLMWLGIGKAAFGTLVRSLAG